MNARRLIAVIGIATALALGAHLLVILPLETEDQSPSHPGARLELQNLLGGGDANGYTQVTGPRRFVFPADHGAHPDYRSEWWYFTGNLQAADGREFGFQLTFFRFALRADPPDRPSVWAARQVYMAHLALTDVTGERVFAEERFGRTALGLAGAQPSPFRIWLYDWQAESEGATLFPMRLHAIGEDFALNLRLTARKPPVLQGEAGYSRKGPEPGNASRYYSYTRLAVEGTVRFARRAHAVTGSAWLDREWGTSALSGKQVGWDWFAVQLDDGSELMYYRFRRRDGSPDPYSSGTYVSTSGDPVKLTAIEVQIQVLQRWRSPVSGVTYPVRWRLHIPSEDLELTMHAKLPQQELDLSIRYWEGAVAVQGRTPAGPVRGHGYVELTGYGAGSAAGR